MGGDFPSAIRGGWLSEEEAYASALPFIVAVRWSADLDDELLGFRIREASRCGRRSWSWAES